MDATLRAASARRSRRTESQDRSLEVQPEDLRRKIRRQINRLLIVFAVDASDSMGSGTLARMTAAKGAMLALLNRVYHRRYRVALVAFRDQSARILLNPTSSLTLAKQRLQNLPVGGATPMADGLQKAWRLIQTEQARMPLVRPMLVLISDGEANVPIEEGQAVTQELLSLAERIGRCKIPSLVIDTKALGERSHEMPSVAKALGAAYYHVQSLRSGRLVKAVQAAET